MSNFRLALAQLDPTVGDLAGNAQLIKSAAQRAQEQDCDLLALPEMMLTGYPIEDLSLRPSFRDAVLVALEKLAADLANEGISDLPVIVGYLDHSHNAAAVLHQGKVVTKYFKHHLPNYGVFDEYRYFTPGTNPCVIRVKNIDVAIAICEDIWQEGGPVSKIKEIGVGLMVVINGSPYEQAKTDTRLSLVQTRAKQINAPVAYLNLVGGQDELVFDGSSIVVSKDGDLISRSKAFETDLLITDLHLEPQSAKSPDLIISTEVVSHNGQNRIESKLEPLAEIWNALTLGLEGYVRKNKMKSVLLGLSGGIDSAVVAALAVDALGKEHVYAVAMPSTYSSDHSLTDAKDLADRTGLNFRTEPIAAMVQSYLQQLNFKGLAEENLQARVRGTLLMGISNAEGHLVLATGNKSELSVGYSTIYGDAVGGFAPIKDVPKTLVWELAKYRNQLAKSRGEIEPIPSSSIEKEPSAELRPNQKDTDTLPDYHLLDQILEAYVENDQTKLTSFEENLTRKIFKMVDQAEYKRRQYPPGTKITQRSFGRDRRLPITNKWQE
jgi:NAD+ synthase (glutamine-hydrolysing)